MTDVVTQQDSKQPSRESIKAFLKNNTDFLIEETELLKQINIPHQTVGVSLIERQVKALRDENAALREQLAQVIQVAEVNQQLFEGVQSLTLVLLATKTLKGLIKEVETCLKKEFDIPFVSLKINIQHCQQELPAKYSLSYEDIVHHFGQDFAEGNILCGSMESDTKKLFFSRKASAIYSSAMVPLGDNASLGILALGSEDAERFSHEVKTDFLRALSQVLAHRLDELLVEDK